MHGSVTTWSPASATLYILRADFKIGAASGLQTRSLGSSRRGAPWSRAERSEVGTQEVHVRIFATLATVITVVAMAGAQPSPRQIITAGSVPNLPFSPAVTAGGFVYVAGAIGDGSTPLPKGDVRAQTKQTLDGIAKTLKAAGSSLGNAASVTVYLRNASDFAGMNEVYATYFPSNPPARTTVVVTQPLANADGLVEISMIAIPDGGERTIVHPAGWAKVPAPYSYG